MKKDSLIQNNINTDADASIKGLYLQKLRVAKYLLKAVLEDKKAVYCTLEYVDDVIEIDMDSEITSITTEQNKNYSTPFSINSEEIKNSIRIFFDNWRKVEEDENISFIFYTNTGISKEKKIGILKELDIDLPDVPIINLLIEKQYDEAFPVILPVFKEYYIQQHNKHINKNDNAVDISYYEELINSIDKEKWKKFFGLIEWKFGQEDEEELTNTLKMYIRYVCDKLDVEHKYVDNIFICLIGLIDYKSLKKNFLDKMVHVAEIKLLFLEWQRDIKLKDKLAVQNNDEGLDPIYEKWDEVNNNDDIRNLEKKYLMYVMILMKMKLYICRRCL
ncbi:hypothetical protein [Terrisporobacter sp.]|uniref:hypothetical protein n=1 Tax=Terrisporobacter sp. TaxID=1965305 RepID=UPI00261222E6|nr:hypothetical protein [Terrisporobacter sp.]